MPRGPKGEKRPADVIGNAVKVMRIAKKGRAVLLGDGAARPKCVGTLSRQLDAA